MMLKNIASLILLLSLPLAAACSYQPEDPGQCKLVCSSSIIGGADTGADGSPIQTFALMTALPAISCQVASAGQAIEGVRSSFLLREKLFDQDGTEVARRPIPNISIEPIIVGSMATIDNGETNPAYRGIVTPRDNWCTDACGVTSIEVVPLCPGVGQKSQVTIQVHSGALFSDPASFDLSTLEPD